MRPLETRNAKALPNEDRFWPKVDKSAGPEKCWIWKGAMYPNGYGGFAMRDFEKGVAKSGYAHRAAYILSFGAIPRKLHVCHTCDVRNCVNPDHLFLGTATDNIRDCISKGRNARGPTHGLVKNPSAAARGERHSSVLHPEKVPKGSKHWGTKLTEADIPKIRAMHIPRIFTCKMIAEKFGVGKSAIVHIIAGDRWKHVK